MHYFVTGHTGFKGAWLTVLLDTLGHSLTGYALAPLPGSLWDRAGLRDIVRDDLRGDVRDAEGVRRAILDAEPDVVLHLAAQSLVREGLRVPELTIDTNLMGTLHVLEAVRVAPTVKAALVVTTDKVYRNDESGRPFVEDDPLGGDDPYSASKAMVELLVSSWTASFDLCPTATARAGNVIGGGDISKDRLLPDLLSAFERGEVAQLRNPRAVRPWQHVLDALSGYVLLADRLQEGRLAGGAWNFGPPKEDFLTVGDVADHCAQVWGDAHWELDGSHQPREAGVLRLDSHRAHEALGWRRKLDAHGSIHWTVEWLREIRAGSAALDVTRKQVAGFLAL